MSYEKLKEFIHDLHKQGFSINEIQKAIITNHNMVLCLEDVQSLLEEAKSAQTAQKRVRAREEKVLSALCEIKKRLVETDCSPLHKESEALYRTIWTAIGKHYGWNKEEDLEDTQDQAQD